MSCFSCSSSREKEVASNGAAPPPTEANEPRALIETAPKKDAPPKEAGGNNNVVVQTFTFQELATATENFRQECLIGVGGFGRVYKGRLDKIGQVVAVKQLDRKGLQGNREFLVEVMMLSTLHYENLVNLIGYCAEGEQRLLVFEYMPHGSLEDHLLVLGPIQKPLDWLTRMKIALGVAKGLEYLHDKANPPVIYRNLKPSNILLDSQFNAKLSDFGLAKLGPVGDKQHVYTRVMGTYGYCAPEYQSTGQLTVKSDVYSFGVVLLELITGRRAIDITRPTEEQNLVTWAQPVFKDPRRYPELVDPLLNEDFPLRGLNQAVAVAAMCLNEEMAVRPLMTDVMTALSYLWLGPGARTITAHMQYPQSDHNMMGGDGANQAEDTTGTVEHEPAVAEAIEWGSNLRCKASSLGGSVSSL